MTDERNSRADHRRHEERICWEIVEAVNSIILRWDKDLKITFINRYAQEFFGYGCDEIIGKSLIGTIVPEESTTGRNLRDMIEDIVRNPDRYVNNLNENERHDGTRVWISWTNHAIRDKQGKVCEIISVGNDVTGLKRAENAVEQHLRITQILLDAIPIPVFYKDATGVYTGCNRAFAAFLGKPKDRIIGRTVYEVAPPDLAGIYHRADDELIRHPGKQTYETSVVATDGVPHDVLFNKATYFNEDGTVGGIIGTILDITKLKNTERELIKAREELERRVRERTEDLEKANRMLRHEIAEHKRDEEALRESEERFRATFEQAAVGITHLGLDGRYIRVNKKFCDIVGYRCEVLLDRTYQDITFPEDVPRQEALTRQLMEGKIDTYSMEKRYILRDGTPVWTNLTVSMVKGTDGQPKYFMGVIEDITERKQAEDAMVKARSRAELYLDLMGHDITNMNQAIMGYLEIAREVLGLKGHEELIEQPLEIIKHSSRLIASVKKLELVQSGKYPTKVINLDTVLKEVVDAYAKVPGRHVRINYLPVEGCYVLANDLLKDVFDNLVDNAIRHSKGPVRIDIAVEPVLQDGRTYYRVSVADNGPGIPDDLKKSIFRFVDMATGAPGRRGLGLYMVRTLVQSYDGKAWVEDRIPGDYRKGSRFVVLLRAAEPYSS